MSRARTVGLRDESVSVIEPTTHITASAIGATLREARQSRHRTVRGLARHLGISPSFISHIERGRTIPSVATLYVIAAELGLTLDHIFKSVQSTASAPWGSGSTDVQQTQRGKRIRLAGSPKREGLTSVPDKRPEFLFVVYAPAAESRQTGDTVRGNGREFAYVIRGQLGINIGGQRLALRRGDSIVFDASLPHRFWVIGHGPAETIQLVVNTDRPHSPSGSVGAQVTFRRASPA